MKKHIFLIAMLVLASCASRDKSDAKTEEKTETPVVAKINTDNLICPQVAIVAAAQEAFDYGGEKADPTQLVARAKMENIEGDCAYRKDGIDIKFILHMVSARGPRLGEKASFPFFIAVVSPSEQILSRQTITASFGFGSASTATDDEKLRVFIPLSEQEQLSGPDYRVLTGFRR